AWWPPTLTPEAVLRTLLAWWTCVAASHSTRRCTRSRASSPARASACTVMPAVNLAAPPDATKGGRVRPHAAGDRGHRVSRRRPGGAPHRHRAAGAGHRPPGRPGRRPARGGGAGPRRPLRRGVAGGGHAG